MVDYIDSGQKNGKGRSLYLRMTKTRLETFSDGIIAHHRYQIMVLELITS